MISSRVFITKVETKEHTAFHVGKFYKLTDSSSSVTQTNKI